MLIAMTGSISAGLVRDWRVPILAYHRFGPAAADSMTVRTATFRGQLAAIAREGLSVITLDRLSGQRPALRLPSGKMVAITADDGHESVYSTMWPLLLQWGVPVTLFLYPSAISHASYALTWPQIREMRQSGLIGIGSHTFWHPDFWREKKRLSAEAYRRFVQAQLTKSKQVLEDRLSVKVSLLAWPFGIYDDELMHAAEEAGYTAAFSIDRRPVSAAERPMALPRFLMTDLDSGTRFERLISCAR
jgi:peptidoglycan/xylan/chitin deacetylase (PgdA/CDA1 family)